ncbi:methyltransferase domain-containing protein [Candidatus Poribacteria bacterium]
MELTDILRCPGTGNKLQFHDEDSIVHVEHSDVTYPIVDGIVDFCPQARDTVSASYDAIASRYDAYMTSSNVFMKGLDRIVWGISDDLTYVDTILSYLPSQFDGVLLDVPVGTGLFTCSLYARFPNATIIAVDYSMGMLQKARSCFQQHNLSNVHLLRADVASLPVRGSVVDIVLSMNGLHVFPDKQRSIAEMRRVIRKQGKLVACCYVKGVRQLSDWFVKHFGVRRGFFTPPFLHMDNIASQLQGFTIGRQGNIKSLVYFEAIDSG